MLYDKDIREPLFDFLDDIYLTNRIIEEKQMGRSRADVVMVTPLAIYGIEIKSDADTYARLKRQVRDYDNFYDYNYVVVGTSHAYHIQEHVPDYWGIITVEQSEGVCDFYVKRKPSKNPKKSKDFVVNKIMEKVPEDILQIQFCEELMERDYNEIGEIIKEYKKQKKQ